MRRARVGRWFGRKSWSVGTMLTFLAVGVLQAMLQRRRLAGTALRGEGQGEQYPQLSRSAVVSHRHPDDRGLRDWFPDGGGGRTVGAAGPWP